LLLQNPPDPSTIALSIDSAQQLGLKDIFILLILLTGLIGLIVLPPNRLIALLAHDVAHNVSASRHAALRGLALADVDYRREQEGFAVLAPEVAAYDVVEVGEVRFACLMVWSDTRGSNGGKEGECLLCSRRFCWS
jgi:hypothetical protein